MEPSPPSPGAERLGKGTFLHLLLGLIHAQKEEIFLAGCPLAHYGRRELSRWLGLVPQLEQIPFPFTVFTWCDPS